MDFLKAQFTRISEQLAGLSATQKMLVFSLVTIMVMTLIFWSRWAGEPEMSPILGDQPLSQEDLGQISTSLETQSIPYKVVGDKIYVPADRKLEIMAVLGYSQALPRDFNSGFSDIIKQMNWLDPPDKTEQMFLQAKDQTLSSIIRRFPGVADAVVVIDPTADRHIGEGDSQPVATVTVTTNRNNKTANRQLAESAADVVCGAQSGLSRSHVNVIVDGVSITVRDRTDDSVSGDDSGVDMQKQYEDYYREKIEQALQDVHGVMVSVTVKVNTAKTTTQIHKVDPKQTVSVPTKTEETSDEQTGGSSGGSDVGAVPNTSVANQGDSLAGGGGGGGGSTSTSDKSEYDTDHGKQDEVIQQGPGDATVLAASVRIPRSYFLAAYKSENGGKDPDDPSALNAYIETQKVQIRGEVKGCAVFPTEDALFVGSYSDVAPPDLPVSQQTVAAGASVAGVVGEHGKEIGVAVLAMLSLFMVSMMVRKGTPPNLVPEPPPEEETKSLDGNETVVGSAAAGKGNLEGIELDEETVKAQQMVEQVQVMVQTNPEAAANLVKRWLNR